MFVEDITSVAEFFITAVLMGKVPLTEHGDTLKPGSVRRTGCGIINLGGTKKNNNSNHNFINNINLSMGASLVFTIALSRSRSYFVILRF